MHNYSDSHTHTDVQVKTLWKRLGWWRFRGGRDDRDKEVWVCTDYKDKHDGAIQRYKRGRLAGKVISKYWDIYRGCKMIELSNKWQIGNPNWPIRNQREA